MKTNQGFNPSLRGFHAVYRENAVNHCPGCGRTHWLIGRLMAECAFCATALPLAESYSRGHGEVRVMRRPSREAAWAA